MLKYQTFLSISSSRVHKYLKILTFTGVSVPLTKAPFDFICFQFNGLEELADLWTSDQNKNGFVRARLWFCCGNKANLHESLMIPYHSTSCLPMAFFSCNSRLVKGGEGEAELSRWDEDGGVLEDFVEDWVTSVSVALAICSAI